jgi:acetyl esterase/lipase/enterochelin esterase-like enzyme
MKTHSKQLTLAVLTLALALMPAFAQERSGRQRGPEVVSPEILEGGQVIFRLLAPGADSVELVSPDLGGLPSPGKMTKDEQGIWSLSYGPVDPPITMRYRFKIDGVIVADPSARATSEANGTVFSLAHIPGLSSQDSGDGPHGTLAEVTYHSKVLGKSRRMHVYTPPGYENDQKNYPVFYLLHGATDSDDSWSTVGRANTILDNLIASEKAVPMIVVMPDGHVSRAGVPNPETGSFEEEFEKDIRPMIEKNYRVKSGRAHRAIAGLSMGGAQTLNITFSNLKDYGYVGVFSSGVFSPGGRGGSTPQGPTWEERHADNLDNPSLKEGLELIWIATGKDDFLIETSRRTVETLRKHDFEIAWKETEGAHWWRVWRDYLTEFTPQLFKEKNGASASIDGNSPDKAAAKSNPESIKIVRDIAYREGKSKAWRLDMAMPAAQSDEPGPALLIVHGGGWSQGSRKVDVFQKMMTDYAQKGYVTVNIDYRLTGEAPFPACLEDVKCAVRWLRAHAGEYHIDPDRIGAYGHSAGAHLALMLAMTSESPGLEGDGGWEDRSSLVNVVVGGSPPTELGRDVPMAKKEWWPIGHVAGNHPPMLLIQGGADRIVRPELTEDFVRKMKAKGADIQYLKIEGGGHGVAYAENLDVTDPVIETFLARHLNPKATSPQSPVNPQSTDVVIEDGGTGPYPAVVTEDRTLPGMTIFRPRDLKSIGVDAKLPILLWGNGACANTTQEHKKFLNEIASHGYVILAIGLLDQIHERNESSRKMTESGQLLDALDWIVAENDSPGSVYLGKIDTTNIASMGMSCGGLQAIQISGDPRISTTIVCNSGVLPEPSPMAGMPPLTKEDLKNFHAPVLYIMGGPSDIAYKNAMDDFSRVNHVPIVMTNLDVGHAGTYGQPHGGKFTPVALAWLEWQLKGQEKASGMFLGEDSTLKRDPEWTVETKNFDR